MRDFSNIRTRDDLAELLGIKKSFLTYILYKAKTDSFYSSFEIPKKAGGTRQIHAPSGALKDIQKRLAVLLGEYQENFREEKNIHTNIAHAFERKKSIYSNARIHRNKRIVLNLDLEHFFDSFHFGRVAGYFEKNTDFLLPHDVAIIIAQLTCYKGHLPQGAPSSPIITNLICQILDMRILKIAKRYRLDYTRYADDLTFSTNDHSFIDKNESFLQELEKEIVRSGFSINQKKTRLTLRDSQQMVTGLVVNKKVHVSAEYYRKTRAMAHNLYANCAFQINGEDGNLAQLEGRFSFINEIDRRNNQLDEAKHNFRSLNGREQQYRQFLFFKYFFAHEKPVIVTEGKTDIRYLKAALKNLWMSYPELITKDSNGRFTYHITFLRKTERLTYFLGIVQDGASAMTTIYNYFSKKENHDFPDYYAWFSKFDSIPSPQPVILLFDNETVTKRPLQKFLGYIDATEKDKQDIQSNLFLCIRPTSNLFLLTNPLVDNQNECEIEYLFQSETREVVIGGKRLCLKDQFDTKKYYGKEIFSQYISQNYTQIDFSGFIPLLDALSQIVKTQATPTENQEQNHQNNQKA